MSVKRITINGTQKVWQARTCLGHVESLRLAHYNGHLVARRGRIPGVTPWRRSRKRRRSQ